MGEEIEVEPNEN